MQNSLPTNTHIHFIGIGGIGMSALAMILVGQGYSVSGSDEKINKHLKPLISKGIKIFKSQNETNIKRICHNKALKPLIVISSAISNQNSELLAAQQENLKIIHRSDILAYLIKNHQSIVVAGSHGKTTTSTFISSFLALTERDPTIAIGGIVPYYKSNHNIGKGIDKFFVAEGDESDGTLIKFRPKIGVITNIELDHIDHYQNIQSLIRVMKEFGRNSNLLIGNYDCKIIRNSLNVDAYYSIEKTKNIHFSAIPIAINGNEILANYFEQEKFISQIEFTVPGLHNLSNLIGAISACRLAGIPFEQLHKRIKGIQTPLRRFEYRGFWQDRIIIDDYAHHPSEVKATISIANLMIHKKTKLYKKIPKRLIAVFQPHRYSRTKNFINEFAKVFSESEATTIIIAPIYSAGEKEIEGFNHYSLSKKIKTINPNLKILTANNYQELISLIQENSMPNDLILNMGAGDINTIWDKLNSSRNKQFPSDIKLVA